MSEKLVVVVGSNGRSSYYEPFEAFGEKGSDELIFTDPDKVLCAVFTGGEDVDPIMYGESRNYKTYCHLPRDLEEQMFFEEAVKHAIPIAGICRGSQFLCAMNGGKLVQHVSNHTSMHKIRTIEGDVVEVTSTHH
jgi:gamma-glutamyl-gamma-aminobutyrate hydrolase PuuD